MGICITPQGCLTDVLGTFWGGLADSIKRAAGEMVTQLFGWWTTTSSATVDTAVLRSAQGYVTTWIGIPVSVLAILAAVAWGVAGGGAGWVRDVTRGLIVFGIVATGSIPIVAAVQAWSESLSSGLLAAVPTRDVGSRFVQLLDLPGVSPVQVSLWAGVVLLVGAFQLVLMLFRDGAVLVLTALLPIAAAGQFSRGSLLWLPKVAGWLLAFIFVKPAAALIYYLGLSLIGQGQGVQALVTGLCVMAAAIFALPAMLRLVTFAVTAAPMGTGALAGAATVAGVAASAAQLIAARPRGSASGGGGSPSGAMASAGHPAAGAAFTAASAVAKVPSRALDRTGGTP